MYRLLVLHYLLEHHYPGPRPRQQRPDQTMAIGASSVILMTPPAYIPIETPAARLAIDETVLLMTTPVYPCWNT